MTQTDPYRYNIRFGAPNPEVLIREDDYRHTTSKTPDTFIRPPPGYPRADTVNIQYEPAGITVRPEYMVDRYDATNIALNDLGFGKPPHHHVVVDTTEGDSKINIRTRKVVSPAMLPSEAEAVPQGVPSEKYILGIYAPGIPPTKKTNDIYSPG